MTGRKVAALIFGVLGVLVGAALVAGATTVLTEDKDVDGFYISDEYNFARSSHAIVSEDFDLLTDAPTWLVDRLTDPVDLRITGITDAAAGLFIGIGPTSDVDAYLSEVALDEVTGIDFDGATIAGVEYLSHVGATVPTAPGLESFWDASTEGVGEQTLDWSLESGNWTAVMMNADGSAGIDADLAFGAKISNIVVVAWIVVAVGAISLIGGGYLMYTAFRRRRTFDELSRTVDLREPSRSIDMPADDKPKIRM